MIEVMEIAPVSAARSDSRYTALQLENVYRSMPRHSRRKKRSSRGCVQILIMMLIHFSRNTILAPKKPFGNPGTFPPLIKCAETLIHILMLQIDGVN